MSTTACVTFMQLHAVLQEIGQLCLVIPVTFSSCSIFVLIVFLAPPHRFTEKGNLEVLLFTIQSKMRANNQKVYMPREGKLISDINKVRRMPQKDVSQVVHSVAFFTLGHVAFVGQK